MGQLPPTEHPDLLVDASSGDDAAVWRTPGNKLLISTADFFGPLVDDPFVWGQIAATNAVSDIYAMGAQPVMALNLVCWPQDLLGLDVLSQTLAGGAEAAQRGGWPVAGGHTVTGAEPLYGQAVTGLAEPEQLLTLSGANPGDLLVLSKPLGTGIITTAAMRSPAQASTTGGEPHPDLPVALPAAFQGAVASMLRLNDQASAIALKHGATAATDITGFGLLGHAFKLCQASQVTAELEASQVPALEGAAELAAAGFVPGGAERNLEFVQPELGRTIVLHQAGAASGAASGTNSDVTDNTADNTTLAVLADPQTSGGLLAAFAPAAAEAALAELIDLGHQAAIIAQLH